MTIPIPDSLEYCPAAIETAEKLIDRLQNCTDYSTDDLSWDIARVRSLERYDMTFTEEEAAYFQHLLKLLNDRTNN